MQSSHLTQTQSYARSLDYLGPKDKSSGFASEELDGMTVAMDEYEDFTAQRSSSRERLRWSLNRNWNPK